MKKNLKNVIKQIDIVNEKQLQYNSHEKVLRFLTKKYK